jgi:hypothetical protein
MGGFLFALETVQRLYREEQHQRDYYEAHHGIEERSVGER